MAIEEEDIYDVNRVNGILRELKRNPDLATDVIEKAAGSDVIEMLVNDHEIDIIHDEKQGHGPVREAILSSEFPSRELKKKVATRGDETHSYDLLVPDRVRKTALGAIQAGKPVVLYGPTGTGKTTFAKQLALATSIGYTLDTASPSWTKQDIVGRIAPDYSDNGVSYTRELGCVSLAIDRARKYKEPYSVIIDEITRSDISKIFGPLYTAIENPHQTIFTKDDGSTIELDENVNIICTMNMSDRTVNQLDNAITRRFAMVEVNDYTEQSRDELFSSWCSKYLSNSDIDTGALQSLFHDEYNRLNGLESEDGIMQFGPMHYRDVTAFLGAVTSPDGVYEDEIPVAVGEAFRTYIAPRLLNSASYSQVTELVDHYDALSEEYNIFDLSPVVDLVKSEKRAEEQRMGVTN